ncbi:MAG: gliding motility-associated C-terminal domain-containing protein [Bacteroidetes bacterium]|nr:gliding motility-associated C-terminal domain-containing protein [Bacteroidota bacterium]
MQRSWLSFLLVLAFSQAGVAQDAGFSMPDTICEDQPVIITNVQPPSASTYQWSFCSGNASYEPDGFNMSNPNQLLNSPRFITLVKDSLEYYTFTTSTGNAKVVRCFFGTSLTSFPTGITDLGNFNVLSDQVRGIQVKKDNGTWYGFVADGNKLVILNFGNSPNNTPVSKVFSMPNVTLASGLAFNKQGTNWVGFVTDLAANKVFRLDFGTSLGNNPAVAALTGTVFPLNSPASIILASEAGAWSAFVCNIGNSTLTRMDFGTSLMNPVISWADFNNINGLNLNAGLTLINDCDGLNGYVTNCVKEADLCIIHLEFKLGLRGSITGYHIQNNGILNKPYGISEFVRQGGTLYAFVANYGSSSITRMFFPSCSGASLPFYTGPDPPPFTYADPGNYNILLTVDDGSASQSSKCKNIVVMPKPVLSLGPDLVVCEGKNTKLDAGAGNSHYYWSNGATTRTIPVDTSGTYWVRTVNNWHCESMDTIMVTVKNNTETLVDTTLCKGLAYPAQNGMQTVPGIYRDTLRMASGCDSIVKTNLQFNDCPLLIWFPNAFTPNGDGLNDLFRPVGNEIGKYNLQIYDRWGTLIFESNNVADGWDGSVKGREAEPDVYTYNATYESRLFPGDTHRATGTFTLAR